MVAGCVSAGPPCLSLLKEQAVPQAITAILSFFFGLLQAERSGSASSKSVRKSLHAARAVAISPANCTIAPVRVETNPDDRGIS